MSGKDQYYIIDFDSTFTQVEALEELAEISLAHSENKAEILEQVKHITDQGMNGKGSFAEGLQQRLDLLKAHKNHLPQLVSRLKEKVSDSVKRNKSFFEDHADQILI